MRSRKHFPLAVTGVALLGLGLGACNVGRNVADDCWVNRSALESANRFRIGLTARNLPGDDPAWAAADARITRASQELRACEDGARGNGRPDVAELSDGHAPSAGGHGPAAGGHGA